MVAYMAPMRGIYVWNQWTRVLFIYADYGFRPENSYVYNHGHNRKKPSGINNISSYVIIIMLIWIFPFPQLMLYAGYYIAKSNKAMCLSM